MDGLILAGLNSPQREAVETLEGPLLILAGAGSGKTRVVTRRIANLIAHGVRPWQILAITFTNKAAQEMRQRVEALLKDMPGDVAPGDVWLSTFHSFCARLLRREATVLGYSRDFTIYDEDDCLSVLKPILKAMGFGDDKRLSPRNARQMISNLKNQALASGDLDGAMYKERVLKQIYIEYEKELKKNNALDFDDLLRLAVVLLRDHPEVLERYQQRLRYILVDEYQDTNGCQYQLVKLLGQKFRNVCATGDPDQSIYAWRGADVRNIMSFEKDFPEAKVVKLEQNYRSTQRILAGADGVIAHNRERKKKTLWTQNAEGEQIVFRDLSDEQLEAHEIAREIDTHVRKGGRYSDVAIFYRTNSQSRPIEDALRNSIPYQIVGGVTFYERREVKDALAYLRLIVNPKDDVSFKRVINVPKRALGASAVELIEQEAARRGVSMAEIFDGPEGEAFLGTFKPKPRQGLIQFLRLLDELRKLPVFPVTPIVKVMLERSGLLQMYGQDGEQERLENLDGLVNAAGEFDEDTDPEKNQPEGPPPEPGAYDGLEEQNQEKASLSGFLEKAALMAPTDNYNTNDDRVTMMTLHMAKGLEFPIVFITGLEEGLLPMIRNNENAEDGGRENEKAVEEERRLMYVGMTRAREKLYLTRAQFRRRFGKADITSPSRFLEEIPRKLLDEKRSKPREWQTDFSAYTSQANRDRAAPKDDAFAAFEKELDTVFSDEQQSRPSRHHDAALKTVVERLLDDGESQQEAGALEIGDRVRHAKFGIGTVETISGSGLSCKVKVHFRDCGPKQLLLSLAKLEKL